MYTRDHPQRRLDDMDLTLDSVDLQNLRDLGPIRADNSLLEGTGFTIDDFYVGQMVEAWIHRAWWMGKIIYKSAQGNLTLRMVGARDGTSGIKPSKCRPAV
jgi:hypothetical protein